MRFGMFLVGLLAALSVSVAAQAKPIHKDGISAAEAEAWLRGLGVHVVVDKTLEGLPVLDGAFEGRRMFLMLDACEKGRCKMATFFSYSISKEKASLVDCNNWNKTNYMTKSLIDDHGDGYLAMEVSLFDSSYEALNEHFATWMWSLQEYDENPKATPTTPSPPSP